MVAGSYDSLVVTGDASVQGLLTCHGALESGAAEFMSEVAVQGKTSLKSDLVVAGNAKFQTIEVHDDMVCKTLSAQGIGVSGDTLLSYTEVFGTLLVVGQTTLREANVRDSHTVQGKSFLGDTTVGTLLATKLVTFSDNLLVAGSTTLQDVEVAALRVNRDVVSSGHFISTSMLAPSVTFGTEDDKGSDTDGLAYVPAVVNGSTDVAGRISISAASADSTVVTLGDLITLFFDVPFFREPVVYVSLGTGDAWGSAAWSVFSVGASNVTFRATAASDNFAGKPMELNYMCIGTSSQPSGTSS
jgi:hypothetical protein